MNELLKNPIFATHAVIAAGFSTLATAIGYPFDSLKALVKVGSSSGKQLTGADVLNRVRTLSRSSERSKSDTGSYSAGSSRNKKVEAVENVSKRYKIDEEVSESNLELKEISNYAKSSEDVLPECSVSDDSEESEGSRRNSNDGDNDPLSMPCLSRFIFVERYDLRTIIDEVGSFLAKISVSSIMAAYQEFKQVPVDQE
ncbi:hypothetical protein CQW23_27880 [Capsicum baccatum]|uniref:Uncharacterized protein n=1 Tax=Capsicum baccatum TaxID=33114 RepID=A0A2G2VEZ8_CAPBA|nr:hypothetical protein CQW23_27880 [Capsicum baccatum]